MRKISKRKKQRWLEAIDKLLRHYQGKKRIYHCPICGNCKTCIWIELENIRCYDYALKKFSTGLPALLYLYENPEWIKDSIKRLKRWKRILKGRKE